MTLRTKKSVRMILLTLTVTLLISMLITDSVYAYYQGVDCFAYCLLWAGDNPQHSQTVVQWERGCYSEGFIRRGQRLMVITSGDDGLGFNATITVDGKNVLVTRIGLLEGIDELAEMTLYNENAPAGKGTISLLDNNFDYNRVGSEAGTISGWPAVVDIYTFKKNAYYITSGRQTPSGDEKIRFAEAFDVIAYSEGHGRVIADHDIAPAGMMVALQPVPDNGYRFKEWKVISGDVNITHNRFIMPESNVVIRAIFEEEEESKPAEVHPDTLEGYFEAAGNHLPGVVMAKTRQGLAAQTLFKASQPAGWAEAFTFNLAINGNTDYTSKNGRLCIFVPQDLRKAGRSYAVMGLDKNGNVMIFNDTDKNPDTLTANIGLQGYAFSLIYKD